MWMGIIFNSYTGFFNSPCLSLDNTFFLKEVSTKLPHSITLLHFFLDCMHIFKSESLCRPTPLSLHNTDINLVKYLT